MTATCGNIGFLRQPCGSNVLINHYGYPLGPGVVETSQVRRQRLAIEQGMPPRLRRYRAEPRCRPSPELAAPLFPKEARDEKAREKKEDIPPQLRHKSG